MKVKMNSENNKVAFFVKIKLFVRGVLILSARKRGAAKPKGNPTTQRTFRLFDVRDNLGYAFFPLRIKI